MKRPDFDPVPITVPAALTAAAAAIIYLRQRRAAARFERLGGAALETLLAAIDANDPVTGAHVRRVARYALTLGDAMDLDARMCHSVERVALFHDIGKIHEALFDITHDAHSLTPEMRREINTHPERGAKVLEPLAAFYPDLPEGVLAHHERWDGTGYPRKLKGRRIPLTARVVAIADNFDAVVHSRPYHAARTPTEGFDAVAEGRGTLFEPALVDLFLSPPVRDSVLKEMRAANRLERSGHPRQETGEQMRAPDVSFRWRTTAPRSGNAGGATK